MDFSGKKKDILNAASECFTRYGYEKTTLDDIGKLVGLNKASLYYYYKNKESIYSEVIVFEAEKFMDTIKDKIDKIKGCKDKILSYLEERFKYFKNAIALHQLSEEITIKFQGMFISLIKMFRGKEVSYISEILKCCIRKGELKECNTEKIANSILSVMEGIKQNRMMCDEECKFSKNADFSKVIEEIKFTVSLILDGLKK